MEQREIQEILKRKLEVLEQIRANTETQRYFIRKRELRGLSRMLREREALIQELAGVNQQLERTEDWRNINGIQPMVQAVTAKEREVFSYCNGVLQEAKSERERIGAELNNLLMRGRLKKQYIVQWKMVAWGNRFNMKK